MFTLVHACLANLLCGKCDAVNVLVAIADEKSSLFWKTGGMLLRGFAFALNGRASEAVQTITSGIAAWWATGSTLWLSLYFSQLASAYADWPTRRGMALHWRSHQHIETTKERWFEAEVNRIAGKSH